MLTQLITPTQPETDLAKRVDASQEFKNSHRIMLFTWLQGMAVKLLPELRPAVPRSHNPTKHVLLHTV